MALLASALRARDARVHLDDDHLAVDRVHRELDVRSAGVDADAPDAREGGITHALVVDVGQRLRRCNGDRVAGVHTHRVEVLDRADHDHVVRVVAHHLELVLLPPDHRVLEQDLADRTGREAVRGDRAQLVLVVRDAGAAPTEDEARAADEREAQLLARDQRSFGGLGDAERLVELRVHLDDLRLQDTEPDLEHRGLEPGAVLRGVDRLDARADQLRVELVEHAGLVQLDGEVQRGLATQGRQHRVGPLALDDAAQAVDVERLDVRGVGELRVGHDRRRVGVHEDDPVALFPQHAARLGSRVVELAGLADDDRAAPDDEDGAEVVAARHVSGSRS